MAWRLEIDLSDEIGHVKKQVFQVVDSGTPATDATAAGEMIEDFKAITDCGINGALMTQQLKAVPTGFTTTAAAAGARYWKEGRISVTLDPAGDSTQTAHTIRVPAIKAALVTNGKIVDAGSAIATWLGNFLAAGACRTADGQPVASTTVNGSSYLENLAHPGTED